MTKAPKSEYLNKDREDFFRDTKRKAEEAISLLKGIIDDVDDFLMDANRLNNTVRGNIIIPDNFDINKPFTVHREFYDGTTEKEYTGGLQYIAELKYYYDGTPGFQDFMFRCSFSFRGYLHAPDIKEVFFFDAEHLEGLVVTQEENLN